MAGFDFWMPYLDGDVNLVRALLAKAQRVCRSYDLEMHYQREYQPDRFYVKVDGPLPMMQATTAVLARVLPPFAEGASEPSDRRRRVRVAERLARSYWKGVMHINEFVSDTSLKFGGTPNSLLFDTRQHDESIDDRLWSLSITLIAYENGQIGPPQMLEEIHTGLEWVMQAAVGSPARDMTYAGMAESLRDAGKLPPELTRQIILMKNLRRDAKHRGGRVDRDEFNRCYVPCIEALHHLLRLIPNGAS